MADRGCELNANKDFLYSNIFRVAELRETKVHCFKTMSGINKLKQKMSVNHLK